MRRAFGVLVFASLLAACESETETTDPSGGAGGIGGAGGGVTCATYEAEIDGVCVAAGVESCAAGFSSDGRGGCVPILPAEACPPGQLAVPGETSCRPVADCGSGKWGDIPVEPTTVYVDVNHTPAPGTGTEQDPFVSITDAVDATPEGGMIAIAAGTITVPITLTKTLRIWGRCPEMVSVTGDALSSGIFIQAANTEVHTLGVSSTGFSFFVEGQDVLLDRVWVHDSPEAGVVGLSPGTIVLRDSLIERVSGLGVANVGAGVTIERSVVRDMQANVDAPGRGVSIEIRTSTMEMGSLHITDSVISGAVESGIAGIGSTLHIERTAVLDTQPQADGRYGFGIVVQGLTFAGDATIRDSFVGNSHVAGIAVLNGTATVEQTTIDGVAPQVSDMGFGDGITLLTTFSPTAVNVVRSRVANATRAGLATFNASVVLESTAFECNSIHLNGEGIGGEYEFDNREGNACFCGDEGADCKVLSESLQPPTL